MRFKSKKRSKPLVILCPILKSYNFQKDGNMAVSCVTQKYSSEGILIFWALPWNASPAPAASFVAEGLKSGP